MFYVIAFTFHFSVLFQGFLQIRNNLEYVSHFAISSLYSDLCQSTCLSVKCLDYLFSEKPVLEPF